MQIGVLKILKSSLKDCRAKLSLSVFCVPYATQDVKSTEYCNKRYIYIYNFTEVQVSRVIIVLL